MKIALTGGGTAGHVSPHLALIPLMRERGWSLFYIGSAGIEKEMITKTDVPFRTIMTGKLRRYFSFQNFLDIFKVLIGTLQAMRVLLLERPNIVFSKGGFVSVPVAIAAKLCNIPVITHESDLTPGLATKIIAKFAARILYTFPETKRDLPEAIARHAGTPVRDSLFLGDRERGRQLCGFSTINRELSKNSNSDSLPVLLITGGSQGAQKINAAVLEAVPELVKKFLVVHLTGRGKTIPFTHPHYKAFEFVGPELADIYAMSDLVIGRAGANSIFEFLALNIPMLLIPLEAGSRGDQVHNALAFQKSGWAQVLRESELTSSTLLSAITTLQQAAGAMKSAQATYDGRGSAAIVLEEISKIAATR